MFRLHTGQTRNTHASRRRKTAVSPRTQINVSEWGGAYRHRGSLPRTPHHRPSLLSHLNCSSSVFGMNVSAVYLVLEMRLVTKPCSSFFSALLA